MRFTTKTSLFSELQREEVLTIGKALDLGCGSGKDAKMLAEVGFAVDAVDKDAELIENINEMKLSLNIQASLTPLQKFAIQTSAYTLTICYYVLHFLTKEESQKIISDMVDGCIEKGVISFTVLGEHDEWKARWSTWTKEEIETLITRLPVKIYKCIEEEGYGRTKAGPLKWWHVRTYVLVKSDS